MNDRKIMRFIKYALDKLLCHPAWTGIGSIAAIVAIVVTLTSPNKPNEHLDIPLTDSATPSIREEPSARYQSDYWDAESYYSNGLYAQAFRAYLSVFESVPQKYQIKTKNRVLQAARSSYNKGNYKLAADQLKGLLAPLYDQGILGQKPVK